MREGAKMAGPVARVVVVLPDGQEVQACLYERRRGLPGWQYRVGVTIWGTGGDSAPTPVEHLVWLEAEQVRPVEGVDYSRIPTRSPAPYTAGRQAWTVQQLPHRPGHPGAAVVHVIGCQPGGTPLDLDQALDALRQPRTVPCHECRAATSLPTIG